MARHITRVTVADYYRDWWNHPHIAEHTIAWYTDSVYVTDIKRDDLYHLYLSNKTELLVSPDTLLDVERY